jgi:hypothetical protein
VDERVLSELPPEVAAEVRRQLRLARAVAPRPPAAARGAAALGGGAGGGAPRRTMAAATGAAARAGGATKRPRPAAARDGGGGGRGGGGRAIGRGAAKHKRGGIGAFFVRSPATPSQPWPNNGGSL